MIRNEALVIHYVNQKVPSPVDQNYNYIPLQKGCERMNVKDVKNLDLNEIMDTMIRELIDVNNMIVDIPEVDLEKDQMLKALMTISTPAQFSDIYYDFEKEYLERIGQKKVIVKSEEITEELLENIYIYKGDITSIKTDAIVNAANEKLLGCFIPGHKCIDNAIHMNAGLHLRKACDDIMVEQGHDEEVGQAKITKGFNLPSKYVIHTVGPNVNGRVKLSPTQVEEQLKACYKSILEAASLYEDINEIVFCSISTGIYGVDIELGSQIALSTINEFLQTRQHHFKRIIIDVFSGEDYNEYKRNAKKYISLS